MNPAEADFRLKSSSLAVDAGISDYAPAADINGKQRSSAPEIGAYEFVQTTPLPPTSSPAGKPGDVNGPNGKSDGRKVDIFDLSFLIRRYER